MWRMRAGVAEFRHAQGQIPILASFEAKAETSGATHNTVSKVLFRKHLEAFALLSF